MKVMNATGRRRVLVVAFDFPPSLEIGAHACRQLTRHLPDSGWEPVVLTVNVPSLPTVNVAVLALVMAGA